MQHVLMDRRAFSLRAVNRMFSFAAFFTARSSPCVIRYDHLAMKLGPDVQEWKFNHWLWLSISDARICKRCSVNQTSFHIPTVYFHFSLIFSRLLACSVRCGAFIQCGGESATDLRPVRYRAKANWIRPEPDSVLRLVQSLMNTSRVRLRSSTTVDENDVRLTTGVSSLNPVQRDILSHHHSQLSDLTIRLYRTTSLKSVSQKW